MAKIKINTSCDEQNGTYYYREFTIVKDLPKAGDAYLGKTVGSVERMKKDPEQPSYDCEDYDCYALTLLPDEGSGDGPETEYAAISNTEPNHMETIVLIQSVLPSVTEANILISRFLDRAADLKEDLDTLDIGRDELVQEYFGISAEKFEEAMLVASLVRPGGFFPVKGDRTETCPGGELVADPFYIQLRRAVPYWWTEEQVLEITLDDIEAAASEKAFPERTAKDLHPEVFGQIISDCDEMGEDWMAEEGYPSWFHMISLVPEEIVGICRQVTEICCCPFRELLKKAGVSQAEFCRRFFISRRTVDDWASGKNRCKIYLRLLFAEKLGLIERRLSGEKD